MSQQAIAQPIDCSQTCTPGGAISTPGPKGDNGANGTNGTNGIDAFTLTADGAGVMPAEGGSVTLNTTTSTAFLGVGQLVYVTTWGYMQVTIVPTSTSVTLKNVADSGTGAYPDNAAPGTALSAGQKISPAGIQGPTGATPSTPFLTVANNLSDVADAGESRINLGLGTAAQHDIGRTDGNAALNDGDLTNGRVVVATANGIGTPTAATARTALGLGTSATIDTGVTNGLLPPVDTTFTSGDAVFATASGVQTKTAAAARTALGLSASALSGGYGRLYYASGLSLAAIADFVVSLGTLTRFRLDRVTLSHATATLGTAQFGVFTAAGGGGTAYALAQAPPNLSSGAGTQGDLVLEAVAGTNYLTANFYFRVTTAQSPQTVDVSIWGWDLS